MSLLILWLASAIVSAIIASNKRRSAIGWFVLGLIFGIFAVAVIAVLRPLTPSEAAIANHGPRAVLPEKTCPQCAETVKAAAHVCRFCGFKFSELEAEI